MEKTTALDRKKEKKLPSYCYYYYCQKPTSPVRAVKNVDSGFPLENLRFNTP